MVKFVIMIRYVVCTVNIIKVESKKKLGILQFLELFATESQKIIFSKSGLWYYFVTFQTTP